MVDITQASSPLFPFLNADFQTPARSLKLSIYPLQSIQSYIDCHRYKMATTATTLLLPDTGINLHSDYLCYLRMQSYSALITLKVTVIQIEL